MPSQLRWVKAKRSGSSGNCVEMARDGETVRVRHSKDPHGSQLVFTVPEIEAWLDGAKRGEFDNLVAE